MAFTEAEKARVRHFLGYPSFASLAQSIQLGYPAVSQPLFLVDDAFHRLTQEGADAVRIDLCECESIERQLSKARTRMQASQIDDLHVNPEEASMLRRELTYWTQRLASDMGVPINPNAPSQFYGAIGAGSLNAQVMG